MSENDESYELLLLRRLEGQGPDHPNTMITVRNLIHGDARGLDRAVGAPTDAPVEISDNTIRLDGDHVDKQIDLIQTATALQQNRVEEYGPDDPRTMVATSYVAYALAFADQFTGQLEVAAVLARDAYEGLDDAAADDPSRLGPHDVRVAELILRWIEDRLVQAEG
ncbi:hypothetical protein BJY24_006418 [Nocardia transvalensis]|uniref:Uncharacterized protein n=1 Tax=Nocardia transvalensis TaxID=37333 RepID=A0A7W9ULF6_9NOCA|nr:hypothetical protein [Nocardia transvalensis]MBB5917506.1 hypothetical protein [Nocardia transvalensis]